MEFMTWVLSTLHINLRSTREISSIIYECSQGELEVVKETTNKQNLEMGNDADQNF